MAGQALRARGDTWSRSSQARWSRGGSPRPGSTRRALGRDSAGPLLRARVQRVLRGLDTAQTHRSPSPRPAPALGRRGGLDGKLDSYGIG